MDESLLPSNEEVEAFNDKVDEVTGLIAGLQASCMMFADLLLLDKSYQAKKLPLAVLTPAGWHHSTRVY